MSVSRQQRRHQEKLAKKAVRKNGASLPQRQMPSQSRGYREAKELDGFAHLRDRLYDLSVMRGDWAGIPMLLEGQRLIIEPKFPNAEKLSAFGCADPDEGDDGWHERNRWYSKKHRADIIIMEKDGKIAWGIKPAFHHITFDLTTLGCSEAWGLEQEQAALQLLCGMISHRQMKHYVLTGMFLEKSKRSGVTYVFRRLKPTVALAAGLPEDSMRILCCLCAHPIAHYAGSWAGAMCPTDDVVAHLTMMRGDEAMYWKRCSQHPPWRPEAGL